ncbi:serine O-acetyltransferase [Marinobacterium jannaschii]|uniref:serine O-acetyltransferase n=1 Tax=Marinobacterium jannaschii TaxID=64970 RepID=UPI00068521F1|nr:DapH/DapD/GlmU-related protein [Marinobacterium jannaschii]
MLITLAVIFVLLLASYIFLIMRKDGFSYSYFIVRCNSGNAKPDFFSYFYLVFTDKGLLALLIYRVANRIGSRVLGRILSRVSEFFTGIEIYYNAKIGKSVQIWHGNGVVIGQSAVIGDNCVILQQVTIGAGFVEIGDNCKLGAGSKILGNIIIGDNVAVAANSVVTMNVSSNSVVGGIPAEVIRSIESTEEVCFGTKK